MPQTARKFTNKDLDTNSFIKNSQSKKYTNADLDTEIPPDIPDDISDSDIPPDIMDESNDTQPLQTVPEDAPDTWSEGFINSVMGGEALDAGLQGLKGYAKGAILNLPSTIYEGAKHAVTHPVDTFLASMGPLGDLIGGTDIMAPVRKITSEAGANPEAFGEMMGELTGQPAVTAGLVKGAPPVIRGMGNVAETSGRIMRRYAPMTGMPVISPFAGRNLMRLERMAGRGIEAVGQRMRNIGRTPNAQETMRNKVTGEAGDIIKEAEEILKKKDTPSTKPTEYHKAPDWDNNDPYVKRLNELTDKFTNGTGTAAELTEAQRINKIVRKIPPYDDPEVRAQLYKEKGFEPNPELSQSIDRLPKIKPIKRRVVADLDGTFRDMDTGQVYDGLGNEVTPEVPLTKDSPFFLKNQERTPIVESTPKKPYTIDNAPPNQRAKILRGMNDPVDVLFADANSRDIFGAGQQMRMSASSQSQANVMQRFTDTSNRISKQYNLPIQQARKLVIDYNAKIRELSKTAPKYGERLNINAPSFEEFMNDLIK